jgi:hypothetical protein
MALRHLKASEADHRRLMRMIIGSAGVLLVLAVDIWVLAPKRAAKAIAMLR